MLTSQYVYMCVYVSHVVPWEQKANIPRYPIAIYMYELTRKKSQWFDFVIMIIWGWPSVNGAYEILGRKFSCAN